MRDIRACQCGRSDTELNIREDQDPEPRGPPDLQRSMLGIRLREKQSVSKPRSPNTLGVSSLQFQPAIVEAKRQYDETLWVTRIISASSSVEHHHR